VWRKKKKVLSLTRNGCEVRLGKLVGSEGKQAGRQAGIKLYWIRGAQCGARFKDTFLSGQAARGPQLNANGLNLEIGTANESIIPV
jgi:hypothetical protein